MQNNSWWDCDIDFSVVGFWYIAYRLQLRVTTYYLTVVGWGENRCVKKRVTPIYREGQREVLTEAAEWLEQFV